MESTPTKIGEVTIVGAGLVGPVLAILLVGKGFTVKIYETRKDPRQKESESRSFNLVLTKRGLDTLKKAGLLHKLLNGNTVPVDSRLVYQRDNSTYVWRYGGKGDILHSIERNRLNRIVLDEAESRGVKIYFNHKVEDCNVQTGKLKILKNNEERFEVESNFIFGCDGAHSVVRMRGFMRDRNARFHYKQSYIPYGYKELHIPVAHDGGFALEETHLHLWPREKFMLMGLPNPDKSITLVLFMPFEKFDEIGTDDQKIITLFEKEFPGVVGKLGGRKEFIKQYSSTKVGQMISIKCDPHHIGQALILGDAAHAMVPFYGQGVNAGFEDCLILDECLEVEENDLLRAVKLYAKDRPKNADAIVGLSLYNFEEMRDFVSKRGFQLKRQVMRLLSKLTGQWITPLYSMVAFTRIPYHEVVKQHIQQEEIWRKIILLIFALIIAAVLYMCLPASNLVAIAVFLVVLFVYFTPMYSWKY